MRSLFFVTVAVLLAGCAGAPQFPTTDIAADDVPRLEQLRAERPDDPGVLVRLGVAYRRADRLEDARATLERAVSLPDASPRAWALLGTVAERQGDYEAAEQAYLEYVDRGGDAAADAARARLAYVRRQLLVQQARQALERETELSQETPDPDVLAVMPLVVEGPEEYDALGRGLAALLTTDLSLTDRLRVLERARLQALLDEMKLGMAGYTDPGSAARAGRLLRAGRMVQGQIVVPEAEDEATQLQAVVVNSASPDDVVESREQGAFDALMDLEVQLALSIYRALGVELTPTELARLRERPTENLQAFLAYSRGLQAMDRGNYSDAAQHFQQAVQLDPNFDAAAQEAAAAQDVASAAEESPDEVAAAAEEEVAEETAEEAEAEEPEAEPEPEPEPESDAAAATTESMVDGSAPAGASAATSTTSETTSESSSSSTQTASGSNPTGSGGTSDTSGGSGNTSDTGEGVDQETTTSTSVPIILVRPQPILIWWRW